MAGGGDRFHVSLSKCGLTNQDMQLGRGLSSGIKQHSITFVSLCCTRKVPVFQTLLPRGRTIPPRSVAIAWRLLVITPPVKRLETTFLLETKWNKCLCPGKLALLIDPKERKLFPVI